MDGSAFFESADPVLLALEREAVRHAYRVRLELDDHLAVRIIERLGEALRD